MKLKVVFLILYPRQPVHFIIMLIIKRVSYEILRNKNGLVIMEWAKPYFVKMSAWLLSHTVCKWTQLKNMTLVLYTDH